MATKTESRKENDEQRKQGGQHADDDAGKPFWVVVVLIVSKLHKGGGLFGRERPEEVSQRKTDCARGRHIFTCENIILVFPLI